MGEICTGCGAVLPENGRFCAECGTPRTPPGCPNCGAPVSGGRFCAECGSPLAAGPPQDAAARPGAAQAPGPARVAERRLASILFGDLVGFTTLSESRDPEEVRELLSRYFAQARTIIGRYGGTVEKFIGDAVMAVWGVPTAREDDAQRAVRAGLDLVMMVAQLGEEIGAEGLALRVGVVTGEVAVTLGATAEGMVAGDPVNTAARVQSAATPGTVWVDDATRALTAAVIAYDDTGTHELKGKAAPVRLFQVRSVGGQERADGLAAPFVGRERQLRLVKELLHETVELGRPRMVLVSGPAGVGKTRLSWELEKYVDGLQDVYAWHRGRCLSYGEGVAFWALVEVVRTRLGLQEADATAVVEQRLATRLPELVPDAEERAWLAPRLAALLGAGDGSYAQDDLFAAWTRFLERAGKDDPVVIVIEDLQFADSGLLVFLEHLLSTAGHPIYVLALARPEVLEEHPELLANRRVSVLHLEPLAEQAMGELVDSLVAGLTGDTRAALVERADGMPLYAVETVRALVDRGLVRRENGRNLLAAGDELDLSAIGAPASLHALVASRLDALPPAERRVVANASVLGLSFTPEGLRALDPGAAELDEAIAGLIRRDVITVQSDRFAADRGQLRFVQAAVRQVAYDTLSRRDRRAAHLAAAEYLAGLEAGEGLSAVVARHLLDAVDASGADDDDVAGLTERAVGLLRSAAERAMALGAAGEAVRHLRLAAERTQDPARRLELEEGLVRATLQAGQLNACIEAAQQVLAELGGGDPVRAAPVAASAARAYIDTDRIREALELLDPLLQSLGEAEAEPSLRAALAVMLELSGAYTRLGDLASAQSAAERMLRVGERLGDDVAVAQALLVLAISWISSGARTAGFYLIRGAAELARKTEQPAILVRALLNESAFSLSTDLAAARAASSEAVELSGRALATYRHYARVNHLLGTFISGDWDEFRRMLPGFAEWLGSAGAPAVAVLTQWVEDAAGSGDTTVHPEAHESQDINDRAWGWQGRSNEALRRGELAAAAAAGAEALAAFIEGAGLQDDFPIVWPYVVRTSIAAGELDRAAAQIAMVADAPRGEVTPLLSAQLAWLQGMLALARGEEPEALLRDGAAALERFGARPAAARARQALAGWLMGQGREAEAAELIEAARATYERLGATAWLAELDELSSPAAAPTASA